MTRRTKLLILLGATVVLLAGAAVPLWRSIAFLAEPSPDDRCRGHKRFEAPVWRDSTAAYSARAPRGCMVDDLLDRTHFRGMPRGDVVALLGPPEHTEYFRDYDLVYWLGPERGFLSIDSEWLVMRLDEQGRVREARLVTD